MENQLPQKSVDPSPVQGPPRFLRLLWRAALNVISGIAFWFFLFEFGGNGVVALESLISPRLLNPALFEQGASILPLLFGTLSGILYFMRTRKSDQLPAGNYSEMKKRMRQQLLRGFLIYMFTALALSALILFVSRGDDAFGIVQAMILILLCIAVGAPYLPIICVLVFVLKKQPDVPAGPPSRIERILTRTALSLTILTGIVFFATLSTTSSSLPILVSSTNELAKNPPLNGTVILTDTEFAYAIKDQTGFAIRYSDYNDLGRNHDGGDMYAWVDPEAIKFYLRTNDSYYSDQRVKDATIKSCTESINVSQSTAIQWGLQESLNAFSQRYDVATSDISVYDCIPLYVVLGVFHRGPSGPGGAFNMSITAPPAQADTYNEFEKAIRGTNPEYPSYSLSSM